MSASSDFTPEQLAFMAEDQKLASIAWGFTLGFGVLTTCKAISQTRAIMQRPNRQSNTYLWLVWGSLLVNLAASILVWLGIDGKITPK
jgi:hypothetical protein